MLTRMFRFIPVLCLPLLMIGCGISAEKSVAESAQKRWDYLIQGNFEQAYHYYTEAFKKTMPYQSFVNTIHGTGLWNRAKVEEVHCDDDGKRCEVKLTVTVSMKMRGLPKPVENSDDVSETWVKEGWFSDWRYIKN